MHDILGLELHAYGYVFLGELDPIVDPKPLDTVVVLKQPYAVKAGDVSLLSCASSA